MMKYGFGVAAVISLLLNSCTENDRPLQAGGEGQTGSACVTMDISEVGALAKAQVIDLQKVYVVLSAEGQDPVYDTIPVSGHGEISISRTYGDLPSLMNWGICVHSKDQNNVTIHSACDSFWVQPMETTPVNLSLESAFSMLAANFFPIRDSATQCQVFVDGVLEGSVSFDKQTLLGDTVTVSFDYLPASLSGEPHTVTLVVRGDFWSLDTVYYMGEQTISAVSGDDAVYNVQLDWVAPTVPPPGQASMTVVLGRVGTVTINGTLEDPSTVGWSFVDVPGLPQGAGLARLWAESPDNVYVWAYVPAGPDAYLYHWDGSSWTQELDMTGHYPSGLDGFGPNDVFASVNTVGTTGRMFHFDGSTWSEQVMPPELAGDHLYGAIVGEPGNVLVKACGNIVRYDGSAWNVLSSVEHLCYTDGLFYLGPDELYITDCWGHTLWDGSSWTWYQGFDFCDAGYGWAMRDQQNVLHMYISGKNNFDNGIRVWKFTEDAPGSMTGSWGSKYGTVLSDPPGTGYRGAGGATGIWGAAPDDIYVTGRRDTEPYKGRVYHYDGQTWSLLTEFGDIPVASFVHGSSAEDVWVSLEDGRLLHYGRE